MKLFRSKKPTSSATPRRRTEARAEPTVAAPTYLRNRTITDRSTVPEVSERAQAHHLRQLRRKIGFSMLAILFVLVAVGVSISQFSGSVVVSATKSTHLTAKVDSDRYEKLFNEYYAVRPFERFRFAMNYDQLTAWLQQSAPEVESVSPGGMERLGVSRYELQFRRPSASWQINDKRYYVDTNGVTFTKNYYDEPTVSVVDHSGARVEQGGAIASSRLLSFVGRVVSLAAQKGVQVREVEIPTQSMRQVYIHGEGMPVVRMTIDKEVGEQVNDMAAALAYFKARGEAPDYIDVRVQGRAFYQ